MKIDFTFAVLVYNHTDYIIEHLESIKYQVDKYGKDINVKLIVSDDGSTDDSICKIEAWLNNNDNLFAKYLILGDGKNRGVGYSFTSIWEYIEGDSFKILAGDDTYSYENIFEESDSLSEADFITGIPLLLINGNVAKSNSLIFHMLATQYIYEGKSFFSKVKNISVLNTPSLIYRKCFIQRKDTLNFIRGFRVTEDFPMMAHLSSIYKNIRFKTVGKVYVYYRRTPGSIYLVENERYNTDKDDVFKYLEDLDTSIVGKLILRNRRYCFKLGGFWGRFLNLSYYIYILRAALKFPRIVSFFSKLNIDEQKHKSHYAFLNSRAKDFELSYLRAGNSDC